MRVVAGRRMCRVSCAAAAVDARRRADDLLSREGQQTWPGARSGNAATGGRACLPPGCQLRRKRRTVHQQSNTAHRQPLPWLCVSVLVRLLQRSRDGSTAGARSQADCLLTSDYVTAAWGRYSVGNRLRSSSGVRGPDSGSDGRMHSCSIRH